MRRGPIFATAALEGEKVGQVVRETRTLATSWAVAATAPRLRSRSSQQLEDMWLFAAGSATADLAATTAKRKTL